MPGNGDMSSKTSSSNKLAAPLTPRASLHTHLWHSHIEECGRAIGGLHAERIAPKHVASQFCIEFSDTQQVVVYSQNKAPQYKPKKIIVLNMGTPTKVPLILGNSQVDLCRQYGTL